MDESSAYFCFGWYDADADEFLYREARCMSYDEYYAAMQSFEELSASAVCFHTHGDKKALPRGTWISPRLP